MSSRRAGTPRRDARLVAIRLSLLAAAAWLLLSGGAPGAARAAPTSTPTLPAPARALSVVLSPSAGTRPAQPASPVPSTTPTPTPSQTPPPGPSPAPTLTPPPHSTPASTPRSAPTHAPTDAPGDPGASTPPAPGDADASSPPAPGDADASTPPAPGDADASSPTEAAAADQADEVSADDVEAPLDWRAFVPTDIADHLATMDRAARESGCGVPWHLLAAISRVESDFGRNMATSSAGAIGYGQFLPSSWQTFGTDGNAYDYRDALPAIAAYLCQAGLARDPRAALFAYNHADWYVDLVLDLAVRYDRMAPGAPVPGVLDVGPAANTGMPMHYAVGRDLRIQNRARTLDGQADWLGVPWRGRTPGVPISATALETTTLGMLRGAFGLTGDSLPAHDPADPDLLTALANRAWAGGLLPLPMDPPGQWSVADIRRHLERAQPVVALLAARSLPGHPPTDFDSDQPVIVIGMTPGGLIYSDPSFSSGLGYGLEMSDADFLRAWQAAPAPLDALAFSARPRPLSREAHLREADPPPAIARVALPPTPIPPPPQTPAALVDSTFEPVRTAALPDVTAPATPIPTAARPAVGAPLAAAAGSDDDATDLSWMVILGAAALVGGAAVIGRRRWRARVPS